MSAGETSERIGELLQRFLGGDGRGLVEGGDDAENAAIEVMVRTHADDTVTAAIDQRVFVAKAGFDRFTGHRPAMQLGEGRSAVRIELVVTLAGQSVSDNSESIEPAVIRHDITEFAIEHRDSGWNVGDKPRHPFRQGALRFQAGLCYHGHKKALQDGLESIALRIKGS